MKLPGLPSAPTGKGVAIGVGALLVLFLVVKNALAKGPNVSVGPPEAPPPDQDYIKAKWITPGMGSYVDVPYFDVPFLSAREIKFQLSLRNRSPSESITFRPQVRMVYGYGTTPYEGDTQRSNVALAPVDLGPGVERIVEGTLPFEGESAIFGQNVWLTLHGRVIPFGRTAGEDRDLDTVVFFTH